MKIKTTSEVKELLTIVRLQGKTKNIHSGRKVLFDLMLERQCREYTGDKIDHIRTFCDSLRKETLENRIFTLKRMMDGLEDKEIFIIGSNSSYSPYSLYFEPIVWYENEEICIIGDAYEETKNIIPVINLFNPKDLEEYLISNGLDK